MLFQPVRPNLVALSDVASLARIDAFEPCLIFSPEKIAAACDINSPSIEDRHSIEIAGTFAAIAVEVVNICFRRGRVEIELPHLLQLLDFARRQFAAQRFECVDHSISTRKKDELVPA